MTLAILTGPGNAGERVQHLPHHLDTHYYIAKGQKTVGPCTLDDLHSYVAYGSVQKGDLVRREGDTEWTPLHHLAELNLEANHPAGTSRHVTSRRRIARYREYGKVPAPQRSSIVLGRLFWGFLLFPPWLWKGSISVFQNRIYSSKQDSQGFLLFWPRWVEPLVSVLLVINSFAWLLLLSWAWQQMGPTVRDLMAQMDPL